MIGSRALPPSQASNADATRRGEPAAWRRLRTRPLGLASLVYLVLAAVIAIGAPLLAVFVTHADPLQTNLDAAFRAADTTNWLGTDQLGRDTLTRLVYGARISLGIGFLTVSVQLAVGATLGMIAGYFGGWLDETIMRIVDTILAFPAIFLFLAMSIVFRPDAIQLSFIIASVGWGLVARLARGDVLSLMQRDFVLAARAVGSPSARILAQHLLPNVAPILIVAASLSVGQIILAEAALDFLGLGVPPTTPSWGNMLTGAQTLLYHSPLLVILPGSAIAVTVLATTLLGNAIRDILDPRLKNT